MNKTEPNIDLAYNGIHFQDVKSAYLNITMISLKPEDPAIFQKSKILSNFYFQGSGHIPIFSFLEMASAKLNIPINSEIKISITENKL